MPDSPEKLPDDALIVRGGRPPFDQPKPLHERCDEHPDGYFGFSVQSAPGLSLDQLASALRNPIVGFTTVGQIRKIGYDVVPTFGFGWHATVVVPRDWTRADADQLAQLFQETRNTTPRKSR
jgi:hypothetical protein